jgi:hypothetical protein
MIQHGAQTSLLSGVVSFASRARCRFHGEQSDPMTQLKSVKSALIAKDLDVSLLKRSLAMWPYAMLLVSVAGFVYLYSPH